MYFRFLITHADCSRVSIAVVCVCDLVILFMSVCVCAHDKTKTAETKIAKLGTGIVHYDTWPTNEY